MAKRKQKKNYLNRRMADKAAVGEKLKTALRSIIRDWKSLREPLPVDEIAGDLPKGCQRYRVRGGESYEELQERVIQFAGRVWQLKDGLIKWLWRQPSLTMVFTDHETSTTLVGKGGPESDKTIEEAAKLNLPLMLCADLYNSHKHYDDCNRSGFQPNLSGVRFDGGECGHFGVYYDGARKTGDITVANPFPVPIRIEIHSGTHRVNFGDAVVVVGRAFIHWAPLIRNAELLSPDAPVDKAILEDLAAVEAAVKECSPFEPTDNAVDISKLPLDQRLLARSDPAAFIAKAGLKAS